MVVITTAIPLLLLPENNFLAVSEILNHSDTCAMPSMFNLPSMFNAVGLLIALKLCPATHALADISIGNCEVKIAFIIAHKEIM